MSKYLKAFDTIRNKAADSYELIGDCVIVEEIKQKEVGKTVKTDAGKQVTIFAPQTTGSDRMVEGVEQDRPLFVRVIDVGEGYYDDESGEEVPLGVFPGDIVLIPTLSVQWFSEFAGSVMSKGERLGKIREGDIQLRFKGEKGYEKVFRIFQSFES